MSLKKNIVVEVEANNESGAKLKATEAHNGGDYTENWSKATDEDWEVEVLGAKKMEDAAIEETSLLLFKMSKNRAKTWNKLLKQTTMAKDHGKLDIIDNIEGEFSDGHSIEVKLCNTDDEGGGPWLDVILWRRVENNPATEEDMQEPQDGPIEGEYSFIVKRNDKEVRLVLKVES
jgi:hypothetical protein